MGRLSSKDRVHAGQAIYGPLTLPVYDFVAFKVNCRVLFGVPVSEITEMFDRNVGTSHLDVGVGTGYFLDTSTATRRRITLVDLNEHSLSYAARRLSRFDVTTHRADVLEPLPVAPKSLDSVSMNFLLHCLPGPMRCKAAALDNVAACVRPGGRIFGATVLTQGVPVAPLARVMFPVLNWRGVMNNRWDSLEGLQKALEVRFVDVRIDVYGSTALFEAQVP